MPTYDFACNQCSSEWTLSVPESYIGKLKGKRFNCLGCHSPDVRLIAFDKYAKSSIGELAAKIFQYEGRLKRVEEVLELGDIDDPHMRI